MSAEINDGGKKLSRVLGPVHVWALGVGIVLVGEYMGWNFTVAQGGTIGAVCACWTIGLMYVSLIMINTEMGSVLPEAGGQYAMAKYFLGPLAAFNIGLMLVLEYAMLEAADALVVGKILQSLSLDVQPLPYIILCLLFLTYLNYRGAYATLTLNFIITAIAFIAIIILLFGSNFWNPAATMLDLKNLTNGLPYGMLGMIAALQFGVWFYLGIEGTALAAEECRSTHRSLPVGAVIGLATLIIGATVTVFVCSGLLDADKLGASSYPLYDAALATGKLALIVVLFVGTMLSCIASANGCINDASRAWFSMSRDKLIPDFFSRVHPKYNSPYRAILFLLPISMVFAFTGFLDQVVTFSIFSALCVYFLVGVMMLRFRRMYPLGSIPRGFTTPFHPLPVVIMLIIVCLTLFGVYLGYWLNMLTGALFYFLASVWFMKRRQKYIVSTSFLSPQNNGWPKPRM